MNFKKEASELLDRLRCVDGVVETRQSVVEAALEKTFKAGFDQGKARAALYVSEEVGTAHVADEIRRLPWCF